MREGIGVGAHAQGIGARAGNRMQPVHEFIAQEAGAITGSGTALG